MSDINKFVELIGRANPATREKIINDLPKEVVVELRKNMNPYGKTVYQSTKHADGKILSFNIINMSKRYLERFAMTSLIGFVYRMVDEWSPAGAEDLPSVNDAKFVSLVNAKLDTLKRNKPEKILSDKITELKNTLKSATEITKEVGQAYLELQITTAKYIKHKLHYLNKDKETLNITMAEYKANLGRVRDMLDNAERRLKVTERKHDLRKEFDKLPAAKEFRDVDLAKLGLRNKEVPDYAKEDPAKTFLTEYDKYHSVENFVEQIKLRNGEKNLLLEDLNKIQEKYNEVDAKISAILAEVNTLDNRLSEIKALVKSKFPGYTLSVDYTEYVDSDDEYQAVVDEVKSELNIEKLKEEYEENIQNNIKDFLDNYFKYNPDLHVQSAYKPNYEDELRTPLVTKTMEYYAGTRTENEHNNDMKEYEKKINKYREIAESKIERSVIPPDDTFARWQRYQDNNYEELRQATDDIYSEKSDLEFSIVPLAVFEGENALENAEAWQRKYADEFEGDVYQAQFGQHNLLGSWSQNRAKRQFYTEKTEIIKRIIKQNEDDQKMGRRLMKDRAQKKKSENIRQTGPDPAGIKEYSKNHLVSNLEEGGAIRVGELDADSVIPEITRSDLVHDSNESTSDEVEVGWKHIVPVRRGRRRIGVTESGKFHIAAEKPNALTKGYKMEPGDMHRHLDITDLKKTLGS